MLRPDELGPDLLDQWRDLQQSREELQSPFLSPEFALAVGRVRPGARVALVEEGDEIVRLVAFERGPAGTGWPIGRGLSDRQAVLSRRGSAVDLPEMLRACGLIAWKFDHLVGDQGSQLGTCTWHGSPVIQLGDGYRTYLRGNSRAAKVMSDAERQVRRLEREIGPVRYVHDDPDPERLRQLLVWKRAQYARTQAADVLAGDVTHVLQEVVAARSPNLVPLLSTLSVGGRLVAAHLGLRSGPGFAYWFPSYDPELSRYSPGTVLLARLLEELAGDGVRDVDLGRGPEDYKRRLASAELTIADGWLARGGGGALLGLARAAKQRYRELGQTA